MRHKRTAEDSAGLIEAGLVLVIYWILLNAWTYP